MFCKNCGNNLDATKKFCINCGAPSPTQPTGAYVVEPRKPWTAGRVVKYILVIGVIVLILAAKVIFSAINTVDNDAVETNNQALSAFDSGNTQDAISQFRQAADSAVTNQNKANSLINLGYAYSSDTRNTEALAAFKEALPYADVDSFEYHLISGEIAYLEGKPAAALASYERAYALKPNEFQINNALALFYLDTGGLYPTYEDYPKALRYALKADEASELETARQNLALAYYFNENYDQAISILTSLTADRDTYIAYFLGLSYLQIGDVANAKLYLKKAINAGVDMPQEIKDYAYAE